jgi:hypothetical protein
MRREIGVVLWVKVLDRDEDCRPSACKHHSTISVMTNDLEHYVDALPYGPQEGQPPCGWAFHFMEGSPHRQEVPLYGSTSNIMLGAAPEPCT